MIFRKTIICLITLLCLLTGCGMSVDQSTVQTNHVTNQEENLVTASVLRVVDGDTLKIEINGEEETMRLLLVDTPETKHPDLPVQPFGEEASRFTENLLSNQQIQIEFDGPQRDKYNRLLGYVWIDGENFNKLLLKEGLARYAYEYDPPYTHQEEMKMAEKQARQEGIGIWSIDDYVSEDGFHADSEDNVIYGSCAEAKEAGVTPLYKEDLGYHLDLDGDRDGIACE